MQHCSDHALQRAFQDQLVLLQPPEHLGIAADDIGRIRIYLAFFEDVIIGPKADLIPEQVQRVLQRLAVFSDAQVKIGLFDLLTVFSQAVQAIERHIIRVERRPDIRARNRHGHIDDGWIQEDPLLAQLEFVEVGIEDLVDLLHLIQRIGVHRDAHCFIHVTVVHRVRTDDLEQRHITVYDPLHPFRDFFHDILAALFRIKDDVFNAISAVLILVYIDIIPVLGQLAGECCIDDHAILLTKRKDHPCRDIIDLAAALAIPAAVFHQRAGPQREGLFDQRICLVTKIVFCQAFVKLFLPDVPHLDHDLFVQQQVCPVLA